MTKFHSLIYVRDKTSCPHLHQIFNHEFQLTVTYDRDEFEAKTSNKDIDIGIICCCYANERDLKMLAELKGKVNHLPLIICSKIPNPNFISRGVKKGLDHFILCNMPREKIRSCLKTVILEDELRVFIEDHINPDVVSPYTERIIKEILHTLPKYLEISELAKILGISTRWTQSLFKKIFGITYSTLKQRILIYQALQLMKNTQLDNTEIAMEMSYSDENSLYRLFRNVLGYSPTQARNYLLKTNPSILLRQKLHSDLRKSS